MGGAAVAIAGPCRWRGRCCHGWRCRGWRLLPRLGAATAGPRHKRDGMYGRCKDSTLERDEATGLPLKAMAAQYVENLRIASAAAMGTLALPEVDETPPAAKKMKK